MFLIYQIAILLILIFSPIIVLIRIINNKEHPIRFKEKFCFFSKKRSSGKLVWFHGASVGEILSIIPLIEKLEKNKKISQILITSNTLSSSKILNNLKFKKTIHQFFPIDTIYHSKKFLNYWKPTIAIFIDSEIWPNMLTTIKEYSISSILLNARITKKSFNRWKRFLPSAKNLFKKFDICFPSSIKSKKYLQFLGAQKVKYIGNLKFSETETNKDYLNNSLKKNFSSRKIWCAASTHDSEEEICARLHKRLKRKYKNLLTIVIPRHINRTQDIINKIKELGLQIQTHDSKKKISKDTDIYLVNTYGMTKSFFKVCKIVFLGGSMIKHGGQNPLESARYGCKILHGPNIWNFYDIYALLKKYNVSQKVNNLNQLELHVDRIFGTKNNSKNIESKIYKLGNKILNLTLKEVNFFIDKR